MIPPIPASQFNDEPDPLNLASLMHEPTGATRNPTARNVPTTTRNKRSVIGGEVSREE